MSKGFIAKPGSQISISKIIVRSALVLSVIALAMVFIVVMTIMSSNDLMNIKGTEISNVPSNVLPSYSSCSFESYDGQTNLSGWFFNCGSSKPISTVIVVHNTGSNRLQYGVDMIDLVEQWLDSNYNVFLFDLRNSGDSGGEISGYGYLEWMDVLGAIKQVKKISVTTDVILFASGTGCTSSIIAYDSLPDEGADEATLSTYSSDIISLGFDKGYIKGFIFDSPAKNSDDYITPLAANNGFAGFITKYFVPYAIRVSAGVDESVNIAAAISRISVPVCIIYGGHDVMIGADDISDIVDERMRLSENSTRALLVPGAGYLEAYSTDEDLYLSTVEEFMSSFFET